MKVMSSLLLVTECHVLKYMIHLLEELENRIKELLLEIAYDEQPKVSEVKNESDLEKMFFAASKKEQISIVSNFSIKYKIQMSLVTSRNDLDSNF